ncbi:hypothetical protein CYMTET_10879 [Cymbomonas tetramitiformis]|uniref:Uncharacterized protein n=1 Tax=Cymbomonas tetramitiformis TaxID=36881 RepID=A0AAE0GNA8_9CHLO|nr:hypothetical protein CYMTET_10879 [Cymbomonas tetramitiformis]
MFNRESVSGAVMRPGGHPAGAGAVMRPGGHPAGAGAVMRPGGHPAGAGAVMRPGGHPAGAGAVRGTQTGRQHFLGPALWAASVVWRAAGSSQKTRVGPASACVALSMTPERCGNLLATSPPSGSAAAQGEGQATGGLPQAWELP